MSDETDLATEREEKERERAITAARRVIEQPRPMPEFCDNECGEPPRERSRYCSSDCREDHEIRLLRMKRQGAR